MAQWIRHRVAGHMKSLHQGSKQGISLSSWITRFARLDKLQSSGRDQRRHLRYTSDLHIHMHTGVPAHTQTCVLTHVQARIPTCSTHTCSLLPLKRKENCVTGADIFIMNQRSSHPWIHLVLHTTFLKEKKKRETYIFELFSVTFCFGEWKDKLTWLNLFGELFRLLWIVKEVLR